MLYANATARTLGMMRFWIFGCAAVSRVFRPAWEAYLIPDYYPVGIMRLIGAEFWVPALSLQAVIAIQVVTIGLLVAVALGVGKYRVLAPIAWLALTISEGMIRGTGVIPHANISLIMTAFVLCFFPAADAFTLAGKRPRPQRSPALYRGALVAVALVFSLTYVFAGARRISDGGVEVYFDDSILTATVVLSSELSPSGGLGVRATELPATAWALRVGFPIVTLLELTTLLCLVSTRFRWLWLAVMLPFHIGTGFLMGIWFWYNLALAPVVMGALPPYRSGSTREDLGRHA